MNNLMPAIFFGLGNPLNALRRNSYTESWRAIVGYESLARDALLSVPTGNTTSR